MKITTEKRPKSILVMDIEVDQDQVEKGLGRAARRLSQKYAIPGFRKGKAPRFIVENYFGREALLEEASDDLIDRSYKQALKDQGVEPVGQGVIESLETDESFRFKVAVPIAPTVTVTNHRDIRLEFTSEEVTEEIVERSLQQRRDRHVVLQELEEARPARKGDQLAVKLQTSIDGEPLEEYEEDEEIPDSTLVLEPDRLVTGLYEGLLGMQIGDEKVIETVIDDDHASEDVRGKTALFQVQLQGIQERLLPEWDELPVLEEVEGTIEDLRDDTRNQLVENARISAERQLVEKYIEGLVANSEYDIPDVLIHNNAEDILQRQGRQFEQYGITLDQMLQYRNQTREQAIEELLPGAEDDLKERLVLFEVVKLERLDISPDEIQREAQEILGGYDENTQQIIAEKMPEQFLDNVASSVLDRKLRERIIAIATGQAPDLAELEAEDEADGEGGPALIAATEAAEAAEDASAIDEAASAETLETAAGETEEGVTKRSSD